MAQRNNCTEILDLIPEYAFGLADEVTARRIEAALPTCPEAVRQLAEYRRLQSDMREEVPQITPPPALALRLRAAIREESVPDLSTVVRQVPRNPVMQEAAPFDADRQKPKRDSELPPNKFMRRTLLFPLVAAAALIALVITNVYWVSRVNSLSTQMQDATALLAQFQSDTFSVRNAESLELVRLSALDEESNSWAMMMWDKASSTGLIYTRNFPQTQIGKVYQLWISRDGTRVSGGTFTVTEEGEGALIFTLPDTISQFERAGITEEPEGGSDAPTSSPLVTGDF